MYFVKSFVVLVSAVTLGSAIPGVDRRAVNTGILERQVAPPAGNACGNNIGSCYDNGCEGAFYTSETTLGTCMAGTYYGCPCNKCGSGDGYVGSCFDNGCDGNSNSTCTNGNYAGCPCLFYSSNNN